MKDRVEIGGVQKLEIDDIDCDGVGQFPVVLALFQAFGKLLTPVKETWSIPPAAELTLEFHTLFSVHQTGCNSRRYETPYSERVEFCPSLRHLNICDQT